ncbi:MAG TPA: hydrogenase expression/formation protein [Casimicrobiaceae bacterium]|nr:hydrogenase expression/formation protein [Casimicrobiaceae bacterium]
MKTVSIPVRVIGPGSQSDEPPVQVLGIDDPVQTFRMPRVPATADAAALGESRALLARFLDLLQAWDVTQQAGPRLSLAGASPAAIAMTDQMLGEGEVSIRIDGGRPARIQESVFAGIWRVAELDAAGQVAAEWIEAAQLPAIVLEAAHAAASPARSTTSLPQGVMNAPALLHEIDSHVRDRRPGSAARVINLTLFPLSSADHAALEQALPVGSVAIMSRGFGNCRITSTLVRNVWRVQYFNTMNTLILNTIEIVEAPEVALAAAEDLIDSRARLAELVAWMGDPEAAEVGGQ